MEFVAKESEEEIEIAGTSSGSDMSDSEIGDNDAKNFNEYAGPKKTPKKIERPKTQTFTKTKKADFNSSSQTKQQGSKKTIQKASQMKAVQENDEADDTDGPAEDTEEPNENDEEVEDDNEPDKPEVISIKNPENKKKVLPSVRQQRPTKQHVVKKKLPLPQSKKDGPISKNEPLEIHDDATEEGLMTDPEVLEIPERRHVSKKRPVPPESTVTGDNIAMPAPKKKPSSSRGGSNKASDLQDFKDSLMQFLLNFKK